MTHTRLIEQLRAIPTSDLMRQAADAIEGLGRDAGMIRLDFCHQHNGMPDQQLVTHDEMRQQFAQLSAENDRLTRALHAAINHPDDPQAAWHAGIAVGRDIERGNAAAQEPLFWYRPVCGGEMYEGPHHHNSASGKALRDEKPGEWVPLFPGAAPVAAQAQPMPMLAADHTGMRVDYSGLLKQARGALARGIKEPALAEMLRQLQEHLQELGTRWYAGDTAVVDEILQLYCIEHDTREALKGDGNDK